MPTASHAILTRKSCRQFVPHKPVPLPLLHELLHASRRSPSGGNVQPVDVIVVTGKARDELVRLAASTPPAGAEYDIYPAGLPDLYKRRRGQVANDMYELLGVENRDIRRKMEQVQRNFAFFDAPVGLFFVLPKLMGPPQWSDAGMFMMTFMLLAEENGLATCAQEAWANHSELLKDKLGISEDCMVFSGMAVGYEDVEAPINRLRTQRADLAEFVVFKHKL